MRVQKLPAGASNFYCAHDHFGRLLTLVAYRRPGPDRKNYADWLRVFDEHGNEVVPGGVDLRPAGAGISVNGVDAWSHPHTGKLIAVLSAPTLGGLLHVEVALR